MRVNADAARCRPSLGVDILIAEGGVGPRPAGAYHHRLGVVLASKAGRDRAVILAVIVDLVTRHWAASKKATSAFVAKGPGYQWPSSQGCPFSGASMPNKRTR